VQRDRADAITALPEQRDRDERLEVFLLELGDVLDARILERVLADEGRLVPLERPPRETLASLEHDRSRQASVRIRRGTQHEPLAVAVEQVDEARVRGARVREQTDDALEYLFEVE
jgi:hypothetical protein